MSVDQQPGGVPEIFSYTGLPEQAGTVGESALHSGQGEIAADSLADEPAQGDVPEGAPTNDEPESAATESPTAYGYEEPAGPKSGWQPTTTASMLSHRGSRGGHYGYGHHGRHGSLPRGRRARAAGVVLAGTALLGVCVAEALTDDGAGASANPAAPFAVTSGAIPAAPGNAIPSPSPTPTAEPIELLSTDVTPGPTPTSTDQLSQLVYFPDSDPAAACEDRIDIRAEDTVTTYGNVHTLQPISCNPLPHGDILYEQSFSEDGYTVSVRIIDNADAERLNQVVNTPTSVYIKGTTPDYDQITRAYRSLGALPDQITLPNNQNITWQDVSTEALNGTLAVHGLEIDGTGPRGQWQQTVVFAGKQTTAEITTTDSSLKLLDSGQNSAAALVWLADIFDPDLASANTNQ